MVSIIGCWRGIEPCA